MSLGMSKMLAGFAIVAALAGCVAGPVQEATPIAVDAGRAAGMVSAYRAANGLGPVGVDSRLNAAAAAQAQAMGERDRLSHSLGFGNSLAARVSRAGYDWGVTAENIGAGYSSLDAVMKGFEVSPEHRRNLLNPGVTEIGIAAVATPPGAKKRSYWALILAAPRPEQPAGPALGAGPVLGF